MDPAVRYHMVVAVAVAAVRHMPSAAGADAGAEEHRRRAVAVVAVRYSIDSSLNSGRFETLEGMIAAGD